MDKRLEAVLRDAVECHYRPNIDDIDAQNILYEIERLRDLVKFMRKMFDAWPHHYASQQAIAAYDEAMKDLS